MERLAVQKPPPILELVIVDNDAPGSARAIAQSARMPFPVCYAIEPEKNISLARNRSVSLARGDWLGFLDDDELPEPDWLERLWDTACRYQADAVLAPLLSQPPPEAPDWIRRGDFFARRRFTTGTVVPRNQFRMSNALIRRDGLLRLQGPFDPAYGRTGGEDGDMLCRLARQGARIVWCDEAAVIEPVEPARLTPRWLLMRAWRGGNDYARKFLAGHYGPAGPLARGAFAARAAVQVLAALGLTALSLPLGRDRWFYWLRKVYGNWGKLAALRGRHYEEYGLPSDPGAP